MSNKTNIRDPIHNYIYMTDVEESVVQHPLFQRLRYISQNGAAYYTYPSNRHDRFLHSLGVMKIGGDIFLNATENLLDHDVQLFLGQAYQFVKKKASNAGLTIISAAEDLISTNNLTFLKYNLSLDGDITFINNELRKTEDSNTAFKLTRVILFQSLRLACLLHDVGHLPYSHTTEYAFADYILKLQGKREMGDQLERNEERFLEDYYNLKRELRVGTVNKEIHEMIGIKMLDEILPSANLRNFQRLCRSIAKQILTEPDQETVIQTLHEVVSGELDSDRLDYSLRDPYSSGLEFGQIDMERILNNFVLVKEKDEFRILPKVQALSAVETFYHNRYLSYKYLIYHHSKARMDQIIGEITFRLILIYFGPSQKVDWIHTILENSHFHFLWSKLNGVIPVANEGDDNYYYCDEGWFNSLLRKIYFACPTDITDKDIKELLLLIETFIFRKTDNIVSLFKRYDIYLNFFETIRNSIEQETGVVLDEGNQGNLIKHCIEFVSDGGLDEFKEKVRQQFDVILLVKMTPPKSLAFDKDGNAKLKMVIGSGSNKKVVPIHRLSPYLESLKRMDNTDQLFHVFLVGESIKIKGTGKQIESELQMFIKTNIREDHST